MGVNHDLSGRLARKLGNPVPRVRKPGEALQDSLDTDEKRSGGDSVL
jgi:hypothetical protein